MVGAGSGGRRLWIFWFRLGFGTVKGGWDSWRVKVFGEVVVVEGLDGLEGVDSF